MELVSGDVTVRLREGETEHGMQGREAPVGGQIRRADVLL